MRTILLMTVAFGAAIEAPGAEPTPIQFTVFAPRPIASLVFQTVADGPFVPLNFFPPARPPAYRYQGEMPITFRDSETGDILAAVSIPTDIDHALLLFLPVSSVGASPRYQIQVLDDSARNHGARGVSFVNLSGLPLVGRLGNHALTLGAGLSPSYGTDGRTQLLLETIARGGRLRSYSDFLVIEPGERALLFLFPPFYAGSLEVQGRLLTD